MLDSPEKHEIPVGRNQISPFADVLSGCAMKDCALSWKSLPCLTNELVSKLGVGMGFHGHRNMFASFLMSVTCL